jgi:RNA polymerase sigma factor (sigma-70 family)
MISFSAEALASMARAGDEAAFERLLAGNRGLVIAAARKACGCRWRQFSQEAIAAAEAGLWLACQAFELGCDHWPRLAYSTMRAEARRALREALGSSRVKAVGGVPGDGLDQIEAKQWQQLNHLEGLNQLDREVAQSLAQGYSQREVANLLGIGRQVVRNSASRIREELRHA